MNIRTLRYGTARHAFGATVRLLCALARQAASATLVLLAGAGPATGQSLDFLTRLFSSIHGVSIYRDGGGFVDSDDLRERGDCGLCGNGFEVLFDVTPFHAESAFHFALGLEVSQLSGFGARVAEMGEPDDSLDLRGAIRSYPVISAKAWWDHGQSHPLLERFVLYGGVSAGLSEMVNLRGYDSQDRQYALDARTIEAGLSGGLYFGLGNRFGVFVEPSVRRRDFASVSYVLVPNLPTTVTEGWPRGLNANSWQIRMGAHVRVHDDTPTRTGLWVATALEGQALPAMFSLRAAASDPGADLVRTDLVSGSLELHDEEWYVLTLHFRESRLTSAGTVVSAEAGTTPTMETGHYEIEGPELRLSSGDGVHGGWIGASTIRLRLKGTNRTLVLGRLP